MRVLTASMLFLSDKSATTTLTLPPLPDPPSLLAASHAALTFSSSSFRRANKTRFAPAFLLPQKCQIRLVSETKGNARRGNGGTDENKMAVAAPIPPDAPVMSTV